MYALRCFLPSTTRGLLSEKYGFREDKDIPIFLEWERKDISTMLKRRLLAYSNGKIASLNQLADGFDLDSIVTDNSNLSPRRYGHLGAVVFNAHFEKANRYVRQECFDPKIDWDKVFEKYRLISKDTVDQALKDLK